MDRHYQSDVTTPSGTTAIAPRTTAVALENSVLVSVEIFVPPGHAGLTGIRIRMSGTQVVPFGGASWIIADNYNRVFPINAEIGSKTISIQTFNTDAFDHTHYVRFHIQEITRQSGIAATPGALVVAQDIVDGLAGEFDPTTGGPVPAIPPPPPIPAPLPPPIIPTP